MERGQLRVRSPIDGRAGLRLVDVGNIVSSGNDGGGAVLVTIQGIDPIYTDFTVAEPDLPLVRKYLGGPNVKVMTDAEDDQCLRGKGNFPLSTTRFNPVPERSRRARVTPNPDRALWPSQFVHVRLILDVLEEFQAGSERRGSDWPKWAVYFCGEAGFDARSSPGQGRAAPGRSHRDHGRS